MNCFVFYYHFKETKCNWFFASLLIGFRPTLEIKIFYRLFRIFLFQFSKLNNRTIEISLIENHLMMNDDEMTL